MLSGRAFALHKISIQYCQGASMLLIWNTFQMLTVGNSIAPWHTGETNKYIRVQGFSV